MAEWQDVRRTVEGRQTTRKGQGTLPDGQLYEANGLRVNGTDTESLFVIPSGPKKKKKKKKKEKKKKKKKKKKKCKPFQSVAPKTTERSVAMTKEKPRKDAQLV